MALAASYAFQHTKTVYTINELCFYRYFAFVSIVLLGYVCFSHYKKYLALAFSFTLSAVALSPFGQEAIELLPSLIPLFAVLMGVTAILIVPKSMGRGFFELLAILILPAVLAESRIGGSVHLLATTESIGYIELSAITALIVGGYFYLRYAALTNLNCLELLASGGHERDIDKLSTWLNLVIILFIIGAFGISTVLMAFGPVFADALRTTILAQPLNVLILAIGTGVTVITVLFILSPALKQLR